MTTRVTGPDLVPETEEESHTASFSSKNDKEKKRSKNREESQKSGNRDLEQHVGDVVETISIPAPTKAGSTERELSYLSSSSGIHTSSIDNNDKAKPNSHRQNVKNRELQAQQEEDSEYLRDDDDRVVYPGAVSSSQINDEDWTDESDDDNTDEKATADIAKPYTARIGTPLDAVKNSNGAGDTFLITNAERVPSDQEQRKIIKEQIIKEAPIAKPVPERKGLDRQVSIWCCLGSCFCCTGCSRLFEMFLEGMQ
jgi:hypothetical protein